MATGQNIRFFHFSAVSRGCSPVEPGPGSRSKVHCVAKATFCYFILSKACWSTFIFKKFSMSSAIFLKRIKQQRAGREREKVKAKPPQKTHQRITHLTFPPAIIVIPFHVICVFSILPINCISSRTCSLHPKKSI